MGLLRADSRQLIPDLFREVAGTDRQDKPREEKQQELCAVLGIHRRGEQPAALPKPGSVPDRRRGVGAVSLPAQLRCQPRPTFGYIPSVPDVKAGIIAVEVDNPFPW